MDRETAWQLVTEHVSDAGLRRHMLAVEAAMRWYATRLGEDPECWGLAGLVHDFDWQIHPTLEDHPAKGAPILRQRGFDEDLVRTVLSHNTEHTGIERGRPIDFGLLACDEVTGLIIACVLVRPSKDIRDLAVKSVKKKWKDKAFAAGVDRAHVEVATADFSRACFEDKLPLWDHVEHVLEAMKGAAETLELDGRL